MHRYFSHRTPGRMLLLTSLVFACLSCGKSSMKVFKVDSGLKDSSALADADDRDMATDPTPSDLTGDMSTSPDLNQSGPDALGQPDNAPRDLAAAKDAVHDGVSDVVPPTDKVPIPEVTGDATLAADATSETDAAASADGSRDARFATEVPAIPAGVVIHTTDELPGADATCVAGVDGWLDVVATYLAEAQKCWEDSDCLPVAFGSLCGTVCVLPVNQYRIAEMDTHSGSFGRENCGTCPNHEDLPPCDPPKGKTYCNGGRCGYR